MSRTAVDFGMVAERTPCGKGVMGYFWSPRQRPHPHSQFQEGALNPESQDSLIAITGRSTRSSTRLLSGPVSSWVKRGPGWTFSHAPSSSDNHADATWQTPGKEDGREAWGC